MHGLDMDLFRAISIHAPREGSDSILICNGLSPVTISIHAPREGSDKIYAILVSCKKHFNPRSP